MVDREQMLAAYERAWTHREEDGIRAELEHCWTSDSTYVSPLTDVVRGLEGLLNLILDFPVMFPGAQVRSTSPPDVHHDVAYFTWRLTSTIPIRMMGRDYGTAVEGVDFIEFDPEGQIRRINAFFGVDHHLGRHRDRSASTKAGSGSTNGTGEGHGGRAVLDLERTARAGLPQPS